MVAIFDCLASTPSLIYVWHPSIVMSSSMLCSFQDFQPLFVSLKRICNDEERVLMQSLKEERVKPRWDYMVSSFVYHRMFLPPFFLRF